MKKVKTDTIQRMITAIQHIICYLFQLLPENVNITVCKNISALDVWRRFSVLGSVQCGGFPNVLVNLADASGHLVTETFITAFH
jgi:hypothetical protein